MQYLAAFLLIAALTNTVVHKLDGSEQKLSRKEKSHLSKNDEKQAQEILAKVNADPANHGEQVNSVDGLSTYLNNPTVTYQENPCHGVPHVHFSHFTGFEFSNGVVTAHREDGSITEFREYKSLLDFMDGARVCRDASSPDWQLSPKWTDIVQPLNDEVLENSVSPWAP
jgi:hypothetical protein